MQSGAVIMALFPSADYFTRRSRQHCVSPLPVPTPGLHRSALKFGLCKNTLCAIRRIGSNPQFLRYDAGSSVLDFVDQEMLSSAIMVASPYRRNADELHYEWDVPSRCFPRLPREGLPQPLARFFYVAAEQIADECLVPSRSTRGRSEANELRCLASRPMLSVIIVGPLRHWPRLSAIIFTEADAVSVRCA